MSAASKPTSRKRPRRRVELTVEIGRTIVAAVANGNTESAACRLARVSVDQLSRWLRFGERGAQPYADFADAYRQALVKCETELVGVIKAAGLVDWRAADKLLGKRFPLDWSEHAARKAVYPDDGTINLGGLTINFMPFDPAAWAKVVEERTAQQSDRQAIDVSPTRLESHRSTREQQMDAVHTRAVEPVVVATPGGSATSPVAKRRDPDPDPTLN